MTVKITIDETACTGHGRCYTFAPELFGDDEFGRGAVLVSEVPHGLEDSARIAEMNCPERAVRVVESERARGDE